MGQPIHVDAIQGRRLDDLAGPLTSRFGLRQSTNGHVQVLARLLQRQTGRLPRLLHALAEVRPLPS